ncbi:M3 family metallopeptidase [Sphingomonas sp.]|jgi:peptidyl-dipeptidase Dcp|uniref:M3 family metallopeptidase n=1 Tax=Sphingomonas sp. TaxID=28214 RepID=UPI002E36BA8C|nr:M3 family metallopeptidase [Sphingomonas sp.]HEX4693156.1 M3 family metallopeptidase [Sphingomonas sp.]
MKPHMLLAATALASLLVTASASPARQAVALARANPLLAPSALPFQAPPFDRIRDSDYQPALDRGMAIQLAEMAKIADNPAAPTFANTIVPMEQSGRTLERAQLAFSAVAGANTNDTIQKVEADEAPKFAAHSDAIFLNPKLFARVNAIYAKRKSLGLTQEQAMLLEVYHQQFVHAGANLNDADKVRLRDLNKQISSLETKFQQTLLAAAKAGALVVDDKAKLAGLSDAEIAAAAQAAKDRGLTGKWVLPLQNTTLQPALGSLTDRATREALFRASWTRATKGDAYDTRAIISQIAMLRAQKAKLLGFPSWADYVLENQMAKTPQAAEAFMAKLVPATAAAERREVAEVNAAIKASGGDFDVRPWDWDLYSEKVRKAKYDLDEAEVKPYFEIDRVLKDGVFYAANQLYGLTFKERHDIPVYQPDVRTFDVIDANGKPLGLMYFDYWKRDNKAGGAWMSNLVNQSYLLGTKPVIYNVANFTKPAAGQPALISFDDVTTMFHEFGHALHGLFAAQTYPTLSGTSVARDFVEFPSQFNEHWALDPKVLAHYAVDYRTGAPMPQALVDKIKRASKFNQGYAMGELIAAAELDMKWHALPAGAPLQDADTFEADALARMGLDITHVPPRYRSSYFLHIWSNGYSAGYYAYLWTQMLDDDAYAWFMAHGGLTRANGQRFRDMILSKGHTMDYGPMFKAFYGKDPDIGPLLEDRGFPGGQ